MSVVAAVKAAAGRERRRTYQFFHSLGFNKEHAAFSCELLRAKEPEGRKKALRDNGLCLFCMKYSAAAQCFSKG